MKSALTAPNASGRARPGRFTVGLVLVCWTVTLLAEAGKYVYLLPVRSYKDPAGIGTSFQVSTLIFTVFVLFISTLGALLVLRAANRQIGWLMLGLGFWLAIVNFTAEYSQYALLVAPGANLPLGLLAAWVQDLWPIPFMLLFSLPFLFPDGKPPMRRWQATFWFHSAAWSLFILIFAFSQRPLANAFLELEAAPANPLGIIPISAVLYNAVFAALVGFSIVAGTASVIARWRSTSGEIRQQIKWMLYAILLMLMTLAASLVNTLFKEAADIDLGIDSFISVAMALTLFGLVTALGIAVFKYRLYDIDLIINRTLVYGALTAVVADGYVLLVTALGAILPARGSLLLSLLATGVIAALFAPLREWLQRIVNRLMFGERDDPYVVLSRLGRQLSSAAVPAATLHTIVEMVATALKLPYAAVELEEEGGYRTRAEYGTAVANPIVLPLVHQNQVVGRLVVAPRTPGEALMSKDWQLLEDIALQAGAVAHAVRLTAALQRSRQRLVTTREEERRRLRRDLHDGLGPTLASHTLRLDTAMGMLYENPDAAVTQLRALSEQTQEIVVSMRQLIHQLWPPVLDELGLIGAVQAFIRRNLRQDSHSAIVAVETTNGLTSLPAAVGLAAYHIAVETITGVMAHPRIEPWQIRFALITRQDDRMLQIHISNDGQGGPKSLFEGFDLTLIRERAEEIGGHLVVEAVQEGGQRLLAELPIVEESLNVSINGVIE